MGGAIPSIPKMVTSVIGGDRSQPAVSGAIKEISGVTSTAPTTAEVSQATATDATGIKRRRRGRSSTILTGAAGVTEGTTLGTPTLLG